MVCDEPKFQVSTSGAAVKAPPSTETRRLAGLSITTCRSTLVVYFVILLSLAEMRLAQNMVTSFKEPIAT